MIVPVANEWVLLLTPDNEIIVFHIPCGSPANYYICKNCFKALSQQELDLLKKRTKIFKLASLPI